MYFVQGEQTQTTNNQNQNTMSQDIIAAVQSGTSVHFRSKNGVVTTTGGELIQFSGSSAIIRKSPGSDDCMIYVIEGNKIKPTKSVRIPR